MLKMFDEHVQVLSISETSLTCVVGRFSSASRQSSVGRWGSNPHSRWSTIPHDTQLSYCGIAGNSYDWNYILSDAEELGRSTVKIKLNQWETCTAVIAQFFCYFFKILKFLKLGRYLGENSNSPWTNSSRFVLQNEKRQSSQETNKLFYEHPAPHSLYRRVSRDFLFLCLPGVGWLERWSRSTFSLSLKIDCYYDYY